MLNKECLQGGENMPNIKSAKKRVKVTEAKTLNNRTFKTALKTSVKKFEAAIAAGDKAAAEAAYKAAATDRAKETALRRMLSYDAKLRAVDKRRELAALSATNWERSNMGRNAWTEDGATVTETITPETIQKALDGMAQAIIRQQDKKGE